MVEDIGKIISNGFDTYSKNLNVSIPFVLNFFISFLIALIAAAIGFMYIFASSLPDFKDAGTPEVLASILLPLLSSHLIEIIILVLIIFFLVISVQAYFISGAIGMAIQATGSGKTSFMELRDAGRKNFLNMLLAEILFGLISFAGIVFIVPGAMKIDFRQIMTSEQTGSLALLLGGFFIWVTYLLILNILLAVFRYALVADNLGPIDSMTASLEFFKKNKSDIVVLFVFVIVLGVAFFIVDQIMAAIPIVSILWGFISMIISGIIIPSLTTIWWVRLYMARTNKKIYFDELLAHPNDLEKIRTN